MLEPRMLIWRGSVWPGHGVIRTEWAPRDHSRLAGPTTYIIHGRESDMPWRGWVGKRGTGWGSEGRKDGRKEG